MSGWICQASDIATISGVSVVVTVYTSSSLLLKDVTFDMRNFGNLYHRRGISKCLNDFTIDVIVFLSFFLV